MTAYNPHEEKFLPKEPLDLPKPLLDLPERSSAEDSTGEEYEDVVTLLSWHAPGRPYRKKGKEYFLNILVIVFAFEIILFLFSQYILMLVVASLAFVAYALATVAPHDFRYRISSEGIMVEDHFFLWQELYDFYFKERDGQKIAHIRTKAYYPGEILLTLGDIHSNHLKSVLLPYLPYREYVKPTFTEKYGTWLEKNFPLDKSAS